MTTTVKTSTRQILIRNWTDLDAKVRNQIPVVVIAILAAIIGYFTGHLSLAAAAAIAGPPVLALLVAYISTSSHKDLILAGIAGGRHLLEEEAPVIEAAVPEAAPVIEDAETLAAAVQNGVLAADTPAPVDAPVQPLASA
jgi:hypothetical protein